MMAPPKLSGKGVRRDGMVKWNTELRLCLKVLHTNFNFDKPQIVSIFNSFFADYIRSCGVAQVSWGRLEAQWRERDLDRWREAMNASTAECHVMKSRVSRVAKQLRLDTSPAPTRPKVPPKALTVAPHPQVKRKATRAELDSFRFSGFPTSAQPPTKRPKVTKRSAVVVIHRRERTEAIKALTPIKLSAGVKSPRSPGSRNPDAVIPYQLPSGTVLWLTPKEHHETEADLVPVSDTIAHPPVSLLFRYWDRDCQSPLTEYGFTAGRFGTTIIAPPPPPSLQEFCWSDAAIHLNRDKVATPFISTTNNFPWVLRLALKEAQRGSVGYITVIDSAHGLNRNAIFHAQPIHKELCKKRPFTNGAFRYQGMHEFLVWAHIPKEAVISTFPVRDLLEFAGRDHTVGEILRLEQLGARMTGFATRILPAFRQQAIPLETPTIAAIARLCHTLRLDVSFVEGISSVVSDVIQSFGLKLKQKSAEEWRKAATVFASEMCKNREAPLAFSDHYRMKWAFLDACRWAGGDFNARQKPKSMCAMLSKAKRNGLGSPVEILTAELDAAKLDIAKHEKRQQHLFHGSASRALLADADEEEDFQVLLDAEGNEEQISYESESDGESVFEL